MRLLAYRDNGHIVTAHLGSWTTTAVTIDLVTVSSLVFPLSVSLPVSLRRPRYPLGSCIPRTRVVVACAGHETRASRRLDARFHGYGIARLLGKCHRSSWIMSPDFRFASIDEGLFRESALLSPDVFDRILHPTKEYQYREMNSSDIIFYLLSLTGKYRTIQVFSRLKGYLVIISCMREIR